MKLHNKNILVTGANGMIAYQLISLLKNKNCNLTLTDIHNKSRFFHNHKYIAGDLRSRKFSNSICKGQDVIFSLVGMKGSPQRCLNAPASLSIPMVQFNANIIESAHINDVEWFLYTSTIGVYEPSEVFYEDSVWETFPSKNDWYGGWAKRMGELHIESLSIEHGWNRYSIVRPANVYGPYDNFGEWSMVIPSLIKKAFDNEIIEVWGDGSPIRDILYSKDVALGMIHMVENEINQPVNLGSGGGVTIKEIAEIVSEYFDKELVWNIEKPMGDMKRLMDTSRAESCGFKPQTILKEGIKKTIKWYEEELSNGLF
tara:strand:- start:1747 stop:2688 length:942 start_codon:yes stop_codon:yes gene_type:complete